MSMNGPKRRTLVESLRDFLAQTRGNVAIVFAFSLIPLIGLVGLATDYGVGLANKAKLDHAADAAALAAVTAAKAYVIANPWDTNDATIVNVGLVQGSMTFKANAGNLPFTAFPNVSIVAGTAPSPPNCWLVTACIYLSRSNQTFTSTVVYNTTTQNHFGQIFGSPTMAVNGTSAASADLPSYLDFYLLVDVSGSMGLPTSAAGMAQLAANNQDDNFDYQQGCQFACHFQGYTGYNYAVTHQIQLRSDAVNLAVCSLLQRAATPSIANQYRIGLYPFINQMATLSPITSNIATLQSTAQCGSPWPLAFTQMLDTGMTQLSTNGDPTTGTGSGGTHFEVVFPQMQSTVSPYGNGSSAQNSRPFVFLITDGMENGQHYGVPTGAGYAYPGQPSQFPGYADAQWDGSSPSQIDPSVCSALKAAGATISILYIPYNQISFVNNGGNIAWENNKVNGLSPTISTPLQACATPGFFYTANSPADITNALNAMFTQAVQMAHLTR